MEQHSNYDYDNLDVLFQGVIIYLGGNWFECKEERSVVCDGKARIESVL